MVDSAFAPTPVDVAEDEEVTVRFTNNGEVAHEARLAYIATRPRARGRRHQ